MPSQGVSVLRPLVLFAPRSGLTAGIKFIAMEENWLPVRDRFWHPCVASLGQGAVALGMGHGNMLRVQAQNLRVQRPTISAALKLKT
jgi:hypothetical protein